MQKTLLQGVILLFSFKLVLTQSYRLLVEDVSTARLSCCDMPTWDSADIDDVKFWRNRTPVNNLGLREKRDVPVFEVENDITFILTREFEGSCCSFCGTHCTYSIMNCSCWRQTIIHCTCSYLYLLHGKCVEHMHNVIVKMSQRGSRVWIVNKLTM